MATKLSLLTGPSQTSGRKVASMVGLLALQRAASVYQVDGVSNGVSCLLIVKIRSRCLQTWTEKTRMSNLLLICG
ncbi:hypothetical protein LTR80_011958, partial [Exophiala xenobiotica]